MNHIDILKSIDLHDTTITKRQFFRKKAMGLGSAALATLVPQTALSAGKAAPGMAHFTPKAKRVIYISLIGAPWQFETFDYKPNLINEYQKNIK